MSSVCSAMAIVPLANRCHYDILNVIVDGEVNSWLLHHLNFLLGNSIIIAYHLLNICLVTTIWSIGTSHVVVRIVMRITLLLVRWLLLTSSCLLRVSSVLATLHPPSGTILLNKWLIYPDQLIYEIVDSLLVVLHG